MTTDNSTTENAHSHLPLHLSHNSISSLLCISTWYVPISHSALFTFHSVQVNQNRLSKDDFLFGKPTSHTMLFVWNPRALRAKGVKFLAFYVRPEGSLNSFPTLPNIRSGHLLLSGLKPFTRYYVNATTKRSAQSFVNLGHFDTTPSGI